MKKRIIFITITAYYLSLITAVHALPFESRLNKGNGFYDRGLFDRAQNVYESILARKKDPLAKYNLGNALYRQGKYAESEKIFETVSGEAADKGLVHKALYNKGNAQFRQENYEGAVNSYEQALKFKDKDQDTLYNLALAKKLLKMPKNQRPKQNKQKQQQQKKPQQKQPQSEPQKKNGLNKQDAERILQGLGNNEKHQGKRKNGKGAGSGEDW
ncbi:hypothetical protein A3K48_06920 [candidate division WOR-1 bacterium RIFOXYA12_FULL_52_29]|uniref:Uncharacterized protein n=1 Tax=candidate division WOR-1 bacterium RIFOXYC12_FULL_54_18 TaxID=1802584 RepID=A0A1F4T806_UNCSA|nr:MAG: hypothetical protein A3K44_06920 [candidate division WOR-1 bacterium RIFOXYA2_FULL_51_19]OGC18253.1 MAG: hypothetical protein A3K48_06920 [candidate division WOR-1 bacterium RIFOXYA12_FULL_52_29]OGC27108.1 MAG: hypothetical protein A3K32_06915 [candidate division WOR-1 bacterium RIFOXYB2_FULL_45_9]OGC28670.1 MAG: hypothetical protein A3K49_06920 [candidate division WOR-1 bacterium RIFOXYC12_FULL_54_18]OGC30875.1 MAG: hypothetical protein A2346_05700 [candidate division WOR-1 bacterium R